MIINTYDEKRTVNGIQVDAKRFAIEGGISQGEINALIADYPEYMLTLEHYLVLYKPPEAIILQDKLDTIATALPDDIAVEHVDLYPVWMAGMALGIGDRVQHNGGLYRVQQAHTAEHPPSVNTAALYSKVTMPGEIPDWSPGSWAIDVKVKHNGKIWLSGVDNNTWEPGAAGVHENIWKEEAA